MADQSHAVGEEVHVVVVLGFVHQGLGRGVDHAAHGPALMGFIDARWMSSISASRSSSSASGSPWIAIRQRSPI